MQDPLSLSKVLILNKFVKSWQCKNRRYCITFNDAASDDHSLRLFQMEMILSQLIQK